MDNWYALHLMSRQILMERQLEAKRLNLVQQSREFDMKNSRIKRKKRQKRLLNYIGKYLETFGKALQKKSQIC